jgi:hypothetical protein
MNWTARPESKYFRVHTVVHLDQNTNKNVLRISALASLEARAEILKKIGILIKTMTPKDILTDL